MQHDLFRIRADLLARVDEVMERYSHPFLGERSLREITTEDARALSDLVGALGRVDEGSYGTCPNCGIELGAEQLAERPSDSLCEECAREDLWRPFKA